MPNGADNSYPMYLGIDLGLERLQEILEMTGNRVQLSDEDGRMAIVILWQILHKQLQINSDLIGRVRELEAKLERKK